MKSALVPLRESAFRRLVAAYTVNDFGRLAGEVTLTLVVFDETGSAIASAALFLALEFLPALLSPPLVSRVERAAPRRALSVLFASECVAFVLLAMLSGEFSLALILGIAAIDGVLGMTARSLARAAGSALLTPRGLLRQGNALINIAWTVSSATAPMVAGLIVAGASARLALLVIAASFGVVAVTVAVTNLPSASDRNNEPWQSRLAQSFRYVRSSAVMVRLFAAQAIAFLLFGLAAPIEVVYVKDSLSGGDVAYAFFVTAWGGGMIAGGFAFAAAQRASLSALLAGSTAVIGIAFVGLALAESLVVSFALAAFAGLGNGVQWVSLMTTIQQLTPQSQQARIVSFANSLSSLMPGIGFLMGGILTSALSARAAFAVAGIGVLATVAIAAIMLRGASWDLAGAEPAPASSSSPPT